jgi:hypothetical protein
MQILPGLREVPIKSLEHGRLGARAGFRLFVRCTHVSCPGETSKLTPSSKFHNVDCRGCCGTDSRSTFYG